MPVRWLVSRTVGVRGFWGMVAVLLFGYAAVTALADAVRAPSVPSVVLFVILLTFFAMAVVLALEAVASGLLRLAPDGYRTLFGRRRRWSDVLALGTGRVDGRDAAVVAVRPDDGDLVDQDAFTGFAEDETALVVAALRERVPVTPGFGELVVGAEHWREVEAEADRAAAVAAEVSGRTPLARDRVAYGFPGLVNTIRLDYGRNADGEGVELLVRAGVDLALVTHGRRWIRQTRRRSADAATQVGLLFGEHTCVVEGATAGGFDRLVVTVPGRRGLVFNAEEPDRF